LVRIGTVRRLVIVGRERIVRPIADELATEGFSVLTAFDGVTALAKLKRTIPDMLIVELPLDDVSGKHICKDVREDDLLSRLPILILRSPGQESDNATGFEMGADAYVTIPVTVRELVARVNSLLWRTDPTPQTSLILRDADLIVDPLTYRVSYLGEQVKMSILEFRLLYFLVSHPNRVFDRKELIKAVWDVRGDIDMRRVDVCVTRLRKKLERNTENPIVLRTVKGSGYAFVPRDVE
jgi:two-component system alkaline phosphatase synthesis response regulator PhoP